MSASGAEHRLASGRFDDVDDESLDDFVGQLGVRASKTKPAG